MSRSRARRPVAVRSGRSHVVRIAAAVSVLVVAVLGPTSPVGAARLVGTARVQGSTTTTTTPLAADDPGLEITGTGTWGVDGMFTALANDLYCTAPRRTSVSYIAKGSGDGRRSFLLGNADFVVSGQPFTDAEKLEMATSKRSVIDAPFAAEAIAFFVAAPYPSGLTTFIPDPVDPENNPGTHGTVTGPIKMPSSTLAKTMIESDGSNSWNDPALRAVFDPNFVTPAHSLAVAVRSDPNELTYELKQFIKNFAPAEWASKLQQERATDTQPETWPFLSTPSRGGASNLAGLVGSWLSPNASSIPDGGVMVPVSPYDAIHQGVLNATRPQGQQTPLFTVQMQNGAGEWQSPTPDSISSAISQGNGADLYGMTQNAPGAYPLTWVDRIYVPSSGLSIDKTNAIATLMRYGVTVGQQRQRTLGEGSITVAMAAETLSKADAVVTGNCTGSDRQVVTVAVSPTSGGDFWPADKAAVPFTGSIKVCQAVAAPTTTTGSAANPSAGSGSSTAASALGSTSSRSSGGTSGAVIPSSGSTGSTGSTGSSASATVPATDTATPVTAAMAANGDTAAADEANAPSAINASPVLATLPMPLPDDGWSPLDRLSTLLMGGLAFLLVRGPARRLLGASR